MEVEGVVVDGMVVGGVLVEERGVVLVVYVWV